MKIKQKNVFLLIFMFLLMGVVQATNKMDLPGEEICLRQIAANNSGNLPQWDYNRVPQKCPLLLNLYENKLYFLAENISVVSNVRIYEYINEIECANFCIDGKSCEVFPLPASWREGDYVIVVTIGDRHYKGTFSL